MTSAQNVRGFTFIELMVTLAILAVLATVSIPSVQLAVKRQREQDLRVSLRELRVAIDAYKRAADEGRIRKEAGASGYPPTLRHLIDGIEDQSNPRRLKIYFLRRVIPDPMAIGFAGEADESWGLRSYASPPDEPAPGADVYDVFSKSPGVGINGVAYSRW